MVGRKRKFTPTPDRIRNLKQYKDLSDDEFNKTYEELFIDKENEPALEYDLIDLEKEQKERVQARLDKLGEDYDLSDMKSNDLMQLESLAQTMIQLEDLEKVVYKRRLDINDSNVFTLEKLNKVLSDLRSDVSKISTDLQLTKKIRNQSKDVSIAKRWDELTKKAYEFYKRKSLYIFCPQCKMLLATIWLQYPNNTGTTITLHCERCGNIFNQSLAGLYETGNKNLEDVKIL